MCLQTNDRDELDLDYFVKMQKSKRMSYVYGYRLTEKNVGFALFRWKYKVLTNVYCEVNVVP